MKTIIAKLPGWSLCIDIAVYKMVLEVHMLLKKKGVFIWKHIDIYSLKGKCNEWYYSCLNDSMATVILCRAVEAAE